MSWPRYNLEQLSESIDYGHTASATDQQTGAKFLRITDIQDGKVSWESVPWCVTSANEAKKYSLAQGDIVFARTGATTGKSYLLQVVPAPTVFASYLIRVRPQTSLVDPRYLARFFETPDYWAQVSSSSSGTAQGGVNASKLKALSVPLPPLPEQRRIAAILDKADALRAQRREAIAKLDQLLQSVFLEMFGDPVTNPKGWPQLPLGTLCLNEDSKRKPIKQADRDERDGPYPYYGASGIIDTFDDYIFEGERLLVGEDGANLVMRNTPIAFIAHGKYWVNNHAHVLAESGAADLRFIERTLELMDLEPYITGSAQPKLNQSQLERILISSPPLSQQKKYREICEQLESERQKLSNQALAIDTFFTSLQQQAFAGNL